MKLLLGRGLPHGIYILTMSALSLFTSCAGIATSAEEYYSIGMAYFEMGKYEEAERWLNRALSLKRTMNASEYNLGRIAFGTGRYREALKKFNAILKKDPKNVMALKAAAYTQIKLGNIEEAQKLYDKILELEPEETDNGVNYATVLYAMDRPAEAEKVLKKYDYTILDDKDALLLLARVQKAQKKPEAIDSYDIWLSKNNDPQVRYEYTLALDDGGFYARALEAARKTLSELSTDTETLKRSTIRFVIARLLLVSDGESNEGIAELTEAIRAGFDDKDTIDALINDERLSKSLRDDVRRTIDDAKKPAQGAAESMESVSTESGESTAEGSSLSTSSSENSTSASTEGETN
ncbi:MAG: tetratricopeptide repeat protein [Spirochaetaceae bacterium]|jgi:tetratricopeptide (TPR) repeat protein|nr:tetratricopeptide repeat protein [Spirochaetaceae bacterium]